MFGKRLGFGYAIGVTALVALLGAGVAARPAVAGELTVFGGEGAYSVHLTTLQELKFRTVIRQKYDFSCGSAALATLLSYHYHMPTKETDVFADMWEHGDKEKIKKLGFSMLDMQQYLKRRGILSNGFRSTIDRLVKADVPGLVLVNRNGYLHFVIVEGIRGDRVLLADPASGTRAMADADFVKHWNGIFFVILDHVKEARATFNRQADWDVQPRAPLDIARNTLNLSNFLLSLPARNVF
ncbi:MAG: C39 family peptidase [Stellaceae bacterium]